MRWKERERGSEEARDARRETHQLKFEEFEAARMTRPSGFRFPCGECGLSVS